LRCAEDRLPAEPEPCKAGELPFAGSEVPWPFSASFFNIFNYDHGCLNTHRDVGIITVVYGLDGDDSSEGAARAEERRLAKETAQLWLEVPSEEKDGSMQWVAPAPGELLLWTGAALEVDGLVPIDHCVRVDPYGEYVAYSHSTRDPDASPNGNRCSIALVLDEEIAE